MFLLSKSSKLMLRKKAAYPSEMYYFSTRQYFITSQEANENTQSCENSKCHATKYYKIIRFSNFDELCEQCEPYLMFHFISFHLLYMRTVTYTTLDLSNYMFDLNASQQPAIIKAAYSSEMLVQC